MALGPIKNLYIFWKSKYQNIISTNFFFFFMKSGFDLSSQHWPTELSMIMGIFSSALSNMIALSDLWVLIT